MSTWTEQDKEYVKENAGKVSFEEMADRLGRTKTLFTSFVHRNRIRYKPEVKTNLILELLSIAFTNPEYFKPTKEFYAEVKITQMRFWSLYRGEAYPTENEYKALKKHFGVTSKHVFENRQLNLFDK